MTFQVRSMAGAKIVAVIYAEFIVLANILSTNACTPGQVIGV